MATLFILLAFGLILGIFAIQNNSAATLHYAGYTLSGIPLYVVVIGSMLIGIALSWILSLFGWASTAMQMSGKDKTIRKYTDRVQDLENRTHELEIENERLRGDVREERVVSEHRTDTPHDRPIDNIVDRVRNAFS